MRTDRKKEARELWEFAIHNNIGSFTLTQEQFAVEDIAVYLGRLKGRWQKEILEMIEEFEGQLIDALRWNKAEYNGLRSQLGIKFDILKGQIEGEEK